MKRPGRITLFTHQWPEQTSHCVGRLIELARESGVEVLVPQAEAEKHGLTE